MERDLRPLASARDVAAHILQKQGSMTAMKLQKLVYYSQAWHLVRTERLLFVDQIEAWAAGPVIRSLYSAHRGKYYLDTPTDVGGDPSILTEEEKKSIDVVVSHYGKLTAEQLSDLTHSEPPWINARVGLGPTDRGSSVIDPTEMADYYGSLARRSRSRS